MKPVEENNSHKIKEVINLELTELEKLVDELTDLGLYPEVKAETIGGFSRNSSSACQLVGSLVSEYYQQLERIAKLGKSGNNSGTLPAEQWDQGAGSFFAQLTDLRDEQKPASLSTEVLDHIKCLQEFHSIFQAGACSSLNPKQVYDSVSLVTKLHPVIKKNLLNDR